ncbi:MAG TPA: TIGR04290 family methyltransferase [Cyclobacteriaceae bacterium]|nr:TIGR04290 family methyltransferase [Cyclobacteriaceae bacterium]
MNNNEQIREDIDKLGPWFHNLHLPSGAQTAPDHFLGDFPTFKWQQLQEHVPADLSGWKVLDIGCNAGFYTFELAKRGAEVLGIDLDPHYLRQARWAAKILGLEERVAFKQMQVYDLWKMEEKFDLVWFMGVFYHLRYPMLALDIVAEKVRKLMVFQTLMMPDRTEKIIQPDYKINDREEMLEAGWPKMAFIEDRLAGDPTNWWVPNQAGIKAMLRTCGLQVIASPVDETYICKPETTLHVARAWNESEFLSATGQIWQDQLELKIQK